MTKATISLMVVFGFASRQLCIPVNVGDMLNFHSRVLYTSWREQQEQANFHILHNEDGDV